MSDNNNDTSDFLVVLLLCMVFIIYLLSTVWFEHVAIVWYWMKYPILKSLQYVPESFLEVGYSWVFWNNDFPQEIKSVTNFFNQYTAKGITTDYFINEELQTTNNPYVKGLDQKGLVSLIDNLLITLYSPFLAYFGYLFFDKISSKERYTNIYSSKSLSIQESKIWPAIKPVVYEFDNMINKPPKDKSNWWAAPESPMEYFSNLNVIKKFKKEEDDDFEEKQEFFQLDIKKLYEKEVDKLGSAWSGIDSLSFEERAVFAILLPRIFGKPKDSEPLENELSIAFSSFPEESDILFSKEQLNKILTLRWLKLNIFKRSKNKTIAKKIKKEAKKSLKKANKLINQNINKYYIDKKTKKPNDKITSIINKHHYKKTVFLRLILEARKKSGVIASCQMIWVKKINRDFWYIISQAGRTASFPEVAGVWSHYLAEIKTGRKMAAPRVENAVFASDKYLFKTHDYYEPFNDYEDD